MSQKTKGSNAERELVHKFWANGFGAIRSAGSGSMKYPSPDILVAKNGRVIAIECKVTQNLYKYFEKREINDLKEFSKFFNAEPYVAVKFKGAGWFFLNIDRLKEKGKSFMIDLDLAKKSGVVFESFI